MSRKASKNRVAEDSSTCKAPAISAAEALSVVALDSGADTQNASGSDLPGPAAAPAMEGVYTSESRPEAAVLQPGHDAELSRLRRKTRMLAIAVRKARQDKQANEKLYHQWNAHRKARTASLEFELRALRTELKREVAMRLAAQRKLLEANAAGTQARDGCSSKSGKGVNDADAARAELAACRAQLRKANIDMKAYGQEAKQAHARAAMLQERLVTAVHEYNASIKKGQAPLRAEIRDLQAQVVAMRTAGGSGLCSLLAASAAVPASSGGTLAASGSGVSQATQLQAKVDALKEVVDNLTKCNEQQRDRLRETRLQLRQSQAENAVLTKRAAAATLTAELAQASAVEQQRLKQQQQVSTPAVLKSEGADIAAQPHHAQHDALHAAAGGAGRAQPSQTMRTGGSEDAAADTEGAVDGSGGGGAAARSSRGIRGRSGMRSAASQPLSRTTSDTAKRMHARLGGAFQEPAATSHAGDGMLHSGAAQGLMLLQQGAAAAAAAAATAAGSDKGVDAHKRSGAASARKRAAAEVEDVEHAAGSAGDAPRDSARVAAKRQASHELLDVAAASGDGGGKGSAMALLLAAADAQSVEESAQAAQMQALAQAQAHSHAVQMGAAVKHMHALQAAARGEGPGGGPAGQLLLPPGMGAALPGGLQGLPLGLQGLPLGLQGAGLMHASDMQSLVSSSAALQLARAGNAMQLQALANSGAGLAQGMQGMLLPQLQLMAGGLPLSMLTQPQLASMGLAGLGGGPGAAMWLNSLPGPGAGSEGHDGG